MKKLFLILLPLICWSCKDDPTCLASDFEGTTTGSWSNDAGCPSGLVTDFRLSGTTETTVSMLNADTLVYTILFNGADDEGCLFQLEDYVGSLIGNGILIEGKLEVRYVDNGGNATCVFSGTIEQ